MDDLIIRVLGGHASPFDVERLTRWRGETPENERYFQEVARVWEFTAPEPQQAITSPPPVEEILALAEPKSGRSQPGRAFHPWRWGLLAASLAAVAVGVRVVGVGGPQLIASYDAPTGGSLTVTLADGSFARLAPGSHLDEIQTDGRREVSLEGRAFFAVARDESRPFVVQAGLGEVGVLGTRFEVAGGGKEEIRAVVVEGRVEVSNPAGSVEIGAGEVARISSDGPPVASRPEDVYALLDWPDGLLVFQGTRLREVAEEVSRQFGRPILLLDDALGDRRITAWFGSEGFSEVAESLCLVINAECSPTENGISMSIPEVSGGLR